MTSRRPAGFTLMELAVVLAILAVAAAILLPRLPRLTGTERTTAIRRLALTLEGNHEEAAIKKKSLAIKYDLSENAYCSEEWRSDQGAYVEREGTRVHLPPGLRLKAVWIPSTLFSEGEVRTLLRPQGDATHTYVHLVDDDGTQYTIEVRPLLGRPEVTPEWVGPTS